MLKSIIFTSLLLYTLLSCFCQSPDYDKLFHQDPAFHNPAYITTRDAIKTLHYSQWTRKLSYYGRCAVDIPLKKSHPVYVFLLLIKNNLSFINIMNIFTESVTVINTHSIRIYHWQQALTHPYIIFTQMKNYSFLMRW